MIKLPVTFDNFSPRADRTVSLRFSSNLEVPDAFFADLASHRSFSGWLVFADSATIEAPTEDVPDREKSPAKRLRNSLYVLWEQRGSNGSFEQYYTDQMNKITERVKINLD